MSSLDSHPSEKKVGLPAPVHNEQDLEHAATHGTYLDYEEQSHISSEHREYLLNRHGTVELDPLPTMCTADPYNWPTWKVYVDLFSISQYLCFDLFLS